MKKLSKEMEDAMARIETSVLPKQEKNEIQLIKQYEERAKSPAGARPTDYQSYKFTGKKSKVEEVREHLPLFRDYYIKHRVKEGKKTSLITLVDNFNEENPDIYFFPNISVIQKHRKLWDGEIAKRITPDRQEQLMILQSLESKKRSTIVPMTRDQIIPTSDNLVAGAAQLGKVLVDDAFQTMQDSQSNGYEDEEILIKKKQYALNVFSYVMRAAQGSQMVDIKRNAEKRETAGFMLDLMSRATAGNLSSEDMQLLTGSVKKEELYGNEG